MECETRENRRYRGISRERCGKDGAYVGRSIAATAEFLGGKPFFMGSEPAGVDATIFAFVASTLGQHFDTPLRTQAERYDNLRRYVGRMAGLRVRLIKAVSFHARVRHLKLTDQLTGVAQK
jgi:glutathione S-transferase